MTKKPMIEMLIIAFVLACISPATFAIEGRQSNRKLVIAGSVVAYDELVPLANITSAPQLEIIIIRVAKRIKGREESRYIKVVYEHLRTDPKLPKEVFDGESLWRFALMKAAANNMSCKGPLQSLKRTIGSQSEELPGDVTMPCYVLRPGDLMPYDTKR